MELPEPLGYVNLRSAQGLGPDDTAALAKTSGGFRTTPVYTADQLRAAVKQEREAAERDAKRYRHMRDTAVFQDRNGPGLYWYLPRFLRGSEAERLDEAIDAAIRARSEQGKD